MTASFARCRDFVSKCLTVARESRPNARELLRHPWLDVRSRATVLKHATCIVHCTVCKAVERSDGAAFLAQLHPVRGLMGGLGKRRRAGLPRGSARLVRAALRRRGTPLGTGASSLPAPPFPLPRSSRHATKSNRIRAREPHPHAHAYTCAHACMLRRTRRAGGHQA